MSKNPSVFSRLKCPKAAVLKLGVATLLRVAKYPRRVAKVEKEEKFGF
jgi:hypothetical protein